MRAYTLSILSSLANTNSPIIEKEIVAWVNTKLKEANKTSSLKSFQDSSIADGKVVIDLVDSIKPGSVNYDVVKSSGTEEVTTQFAFTKKKTGQHAESNINLLLFCRTTSPMPSTPFRWPAKSVHVCTPCPKTSPKSNRKWWWPSSPVSWQWITYPTWIQYKTKTMWMQSKRHHNEPVHPSVKLYNKSKICFCFFFLSCFKTRHTKITNWIIVWKIFGFQTFFCSRYVIFEQRDCPISSVCIWKLINHYSSFGWSVVKRIIKYV